jgi:hypothetical protein
MQERTENEPGMGGHDRRCDRPDHRSESAMTLYRGDVHPPSQPQARQSPPQARRGISLTSNEMLRLAPRLKSCSPKQGQTGPGLVDAAASPRSN